MATNKVIYAGNTLIDLSSDTITASDLLQGVVAHDKTGNTITGTLTVPEQQEKTVNDLLLVHGNQTIVPDVGKTLSKVIINKPDTLIAENVKKDITIAGVVGTLEPTLQKKTVTPRTSAQTITPDTDYDGLSQVTIEAIPTVIQATPSITVDSTGLITASTTQSEGYVTSGKKSATQQLTRQLGKTVTPGTSDVVAVESGKYTTGTVYVKGDSNLTADNIKSGISIFGVTGRYDGDSGDYKFEFGSFTPTTNAKTYVVNHSLGKTPVMIAFSANKFPTGRYNTSGVAMAGITNEGFISYGGGIGIDMLRCGGYDYYGAYNSWYGNLCFAIRSVSSTNFTIGYNHNYSSSVGCKAGVTYYWVAIA